MRLRPVTVALVFAFIVASPSAAQQTLQSPLPQSPPPLTAAVMLTADDANAWLDGYMPYALKTGDIAGAVVARAGRLF